jgi:poly(A) polymerase
VAIQTKPVKGMEPTGKLPPTDWLMAPETRAVMEALCAYGADVRFVGGCVRDSLSGKPVTDIDIATPDLPDTVIQLLQSSGIRAVPTGIEHGTVTAVIEGKSFEITTLRRDIETDGRRAEVAFTTDWIEDAKRRDFTINTLSATLDGDVYDPGSGISDIAYGWVRFVGRASERIAEDHLRILRFYRFYGSFSQPYADIDARSACRAAAGELINLSGERISQELLKILLLSDPAEIVIRMKGDHILDDILPEAGDVNLLRLVNWFETRAIRIDGIEPDAIRHLAALVETDRQGARALCQRLRLSNKDADRLADICDPPVNVSPDMGELAEQKALRRYGHELLEDLALLNWAREMSDNPRLPRLRKDAWVSLLERCGTWENPKFPISGRDVLALGIARGPDVGRLLTRVEEWWENGNYQADRQACLNRLVEETK